MFEPTNHFNIAADDERADAAEKLLAEQSSQPITILQILPMAYLLLAPLQKELLPI